MKPQREGMIWQVLGLLVVIAAALEIRSAAQQFTWTLNESKHAGYMDVVWPFAMGVFAGFLLLAGASAMISGHVLRVMCGVPHRGWIWKLAGALCCLAGIVAIVAKMITVAMSRSVRIAQAYDFYEMVGSGGFAIWISGGYIFLLGIMLLLADRLGKRLRPASSAEAQPGP